MMLIEIHTTVSQKKLKKKHRKTLQKKGKWGF